MGYEALRDFKQTQMRGLKMGLGYVFFSTQENIETEDAAIVVLIARLG